MTPMPTIARLFATVSLGGGLLMLAGCDTMQPDRLLTPQERQPVAPSLSKAPVVSIVPGPAIGATEIRTYVGRFQKGVLLSSYDSLGKVENYYSFDAKATRKGTATGTFQFVSAYRNVAVVLTGTVTCFTVTGNRARIGGIVTASSFPEIPVGTSETWSITDESATGGAQTGSSLLGGTGTYALDYCAFGLPYPELPYLSGGVQILRQG